MIEEAYCSFEVSKLLKEKGFDEKVSTYYLVHSNDFPEFFDKKDEFPDPEDVWLKCPTHQMATKWLREVHDIFIKFESVTASGITEWHPSLNLITENKYIHANKLHWYPSYEEAVEAALKYCLENLI